MRALILSNDGSTVENVIILGDGAAPSDFGAVAAPSDAIGPGWTLVDGAWTAPVAAPVGLSPAEEKAAATAAISALVHATARARGYDSGESCASYVSSTIAAWAAEATAFVAWRDEVWMQAVATLAEVEAGTISPPTVDEIVGALPIIEWPATA